MDLRRTVASDPGARARVGPLAFGLFIGQQDARYRRAPAAIFVAALVVGLAAIMLAVGQTPAGEVLLAAGAVLGALVAIARPLPRLIGWLAAAVTGAAIGLDSPPQVISIALATVTLIGTGLGACIALAIVVGVTACLRRYWQLLGVHFGLVDRGQRGARPRGGRSSRYA